jgi:hypothetical protein
MTRCEPAVCACAVSWIDPPRQRRSPRGVSQGELARQVRNTRIDFASLGLPADVTHALADAFWQHFGVRDARSVLVLGRT